MALKYGSKSGGFGLRSGNKKGMPFKEMGSSPAKEGILGTAIDLINPKDEVESKEISKIQIEKIPSLKAPGVEKAKLSDEPIKPSKTFEETSAEIASEKKLAKKEKREKFRKELGAGLEEAGASISGAWGKGGTGSYMTANQRYKSMKLDQETKRLNNEWRANRNAKNEALTLGGEGDKGIDNQDAITGTESDPLGENVQKTNVASVTENSEKENREQMYGDKLKGYKLQG